jgi:hypothetical protein
MRRQWQYWRKAVDPRWQKLYDKLGEYQANYGQIADQAHSQNNLERAVYYRGLERGMRIVRSHIEDVLEVTE